MGHYVYSKDNIFDQKQAQPGLSPRTTPSQSPNLDQKKPVSPNQKEVKRRIEMQLNKLMTTCVIMRIEDFTLYKVTTSGKKQALKEFVAGKSKKLLTVLNKINFLH